MQIGIGIIFVRWEVFANNLLIPGICFFSNKFLIVILTLIYFFFENLPGKQSHSEIHEYSLTIFNIRIRYL